jgi:phosphoribosyl-ATP pyrophosphohydrolase
MGKATKKKIVKRPAKAVPAGVKPAKPKAAKLKLAKPKLTKPKKKAALVATHVTAPLLAEGGVLDRLWAVVMNRRNASPSVSHSARLLSRGVAKVAQKFGEEAVEALIEAVAGNREALIAESADVLYHLIVLWVATGIAPEDVWAELRRREGVSGIAEKAARTLPVALRPNTRKIP